MAMFGDFSLGQLLPFIFLWFLVGLLVALMVGRWFRRHGGDTALGGREVQWFNAYGRLELVQLGDLVLLRCAVCGQVFSQVRRAALVMGQLKMEAAMPLPLKALQHQCPWIKKQTKKQTYNANYHA